MEANISSRYPSTSPSPSASPTVSPAPPPPTRIASPEGPQLPAPSLSHSSSGKQGLISAQRVLEHRAATVSGGNKLLNQTLSSAAATVVGRACDPQTCERFERHHGNKDRANGHIEPCNRDSSNSTGLKAPVRSVTAPDTLEDTNVEDQPRNFTAELSRSRDPAIANCLDNAAKNRQTVERPQQQQPPLPGPFPKSEKDSYDDKCSISQVSERAQITLARLRMYREVRCSMQSQTSSESTREISNKLLERSYEESKNKDKKYRQKCEEQKKLVEVAAAEPKAGDKFVAGPHQNTSGANSSAPLKKTTAAVHERGREPYKNDIQKKTDKPSASIVHSTSIATTKEQKAKNGETPRSANAGIKAQARETITVAAAIGVGSPKKPADAAAPLAKNIVAAQNSGLNEGIAGVGSGAPASNPTTFAATPAQPHRTGVQKQPHKNTIAALNDTKLKGFEDVDISPNGEQELADWDVVLKGDEDETWVKDESSWDCKEEEEEAPLETDGEWAKVPYEEVI